MATQQLEFFFTAADDFEEQLRYMLEVQQLTLREVGKQLGKDQVSIHYYAKKFGIDLRRRHRAKNRREEIYQLHLDGVPTKEIARLIGCAVRTVQSICRDFERHATNEALGLADDGPFTRNQWGASGEAKDNGEVLSVKVWRCPKHGIVKFRPCIACMAESNNGA